MRFGHYLASLGNAIVPKSRVFVLCENVIFKRQNMSIFATENARVSSGHIVLQNKLFQKILSGNTICVKHFGSVEPALGPNCLQKL